MAEFKPPKHLVIGSDENPTNKWRDWIELFDLYMDIQTHSYTEKPKVFLLLYSLGPEYMTVFKNFDFDVPSDVENVNVVKAKFEAYCEPKKLLKKFLTAFQSRVQKDNNYVDRYDDDTDNLCVFSVASNEMHRDKWKVNLSIFGNDYDFMIDTLAQCTVIPYHIHTHFHKKAPYAY